MTGDAARSIILRNALDLMGCYVCICNGPVVTWLFTKQFKDDGWNSSTVWCTNILNSFICRKLLYLLLTQNEGEIRDGIKFKTFNSGNRVVHKSFVHVLMFFVSIVSPYPLRTLQPVTHISHTTIVLLNTTGPSTSLLFENFHNKSQVFIVSWVSFILLSYRQHNRITLHRFICQRHTISVNYHRPSFICRCIFICMSSNYEAGLLS